MHIQVGDIVHFVPINEIPYFAAYIRFHGGGNLLTHNVPPHAPMPGFSDVMQAVEIGFRVVFRLLRGEPLGTYRDFCEMLDYLGVDVASAWNVGDVLEAITQPEGRRTARDAGPRS